MTIKSLLFCGEGHEIPGSVFRDLTLDKDFGEGTLSLMKNSCTPDGIRKRQKLISSAMESDEVSGRLGEAEELCDRLRILLGAVSASENEEEKILLFVPLMRYYFSAVRALSSVECGEPEYFRSLLDECSEEEKMYLRAADRFDGKIRLRVKGSDVRSMRSRSSRKNELEKMLCGMGLEDAIPPRQRPQKAQSEIIKGFAGLNSGSENDYYLTAKELYAAYSEKYLGGYLAEFVKYADEARFVLDVCSYFLKLRDAGYPVTFPEVSQEREVIVHGLYDPSLYKRGMSADSCVPNDVGMRLSAERRENFFILTGANGGGKTTYLRACAAAVLFFMLGCPITAHSAAIYPFTSIYTHFPSDESFENSGRFADEALRADEIISKADGDSFAVFNETYSGTDEKKSEDYSRRLALEMYGRGVFGIFVTHIHSLTGGEIPTLAAVIDENDENRRTYKIKRVRSTDSSYAEDILKEYGLDRESLEKKLEEQNG